MTKVLVTGSNGLLGQKLIYNLLSRNDIELMATARGENRIRITEGYEYRELDITSRSNVQSIFNYFKPDLVIHAAAMTNVDACESERELCWDINVNGVQHIVDACKENNAHLVHVSTDFVFDGEDGPYRENAKTNPLSYYAESKLEGENIISNSTLSWSIIRTIIVYGIVDDMSRSNLMLWAKGALEKGNPINVVDDQFRAPTLAEDLAEGCILAGLQKAKGIFHISGDEILSIIDIVRRVAEFYTLDASLIKPVSSETLNQAAKRPPYTGFILDKAKSILGYRPHTLIEGLEIMKQQQENIKV